MSDAIVVNNLSKKYELGLAQRDTMLRERLVNLLRAPFSRESRPKTEVFWALSDISFRIAQGEVVGIIGKNGAGKSTLLKLLSRITYPTSGNVKVAGRVASLLEVGTGFHEELTGRENIFLNGSILGMKQREVIQKLDAIVEFSGTERFLDTPIKRYSSGMRLRLGFAVAAHLDPDVLIVDEVLAVGDAGFQKKCLTAMEGLHSGGRTVLFVSHNMAAVENLCPRSIWIDAGRIKMDGPTHDVIEAYMTTYSDAQSNSADLDEAKERRGSGEIRYRKIEFLDDKGAQKTFIRPGDKITVRLHYEAKQPIQYPSFGFRLVTETDTLITETSTWHHGLDIEQVEPGEGHLDLVIDALTLMPGRYFLTLGLTGTGAHLYDWLEHAVRLDIESTSIYDSNVQLDTRHGVVFFPQRWRLDGLTVNHQPAVVARS